MIAGLTVLAVVLLLAAVATLIAHQLNDDPVSRMLRSVGCVCMPSYCSTTCEACLERTRGTPCYRQRIPA